MTYKKIVINEMTSKKQGRPFLWSAFIVSQKNNSGDDGLDL